MSESSEPDPVPVRGRGMKVLAVVLGLAVVLVGALAIAFWIASRDLPTADDGDMRWVPVDVPPEENAFASIEDAAARLDWPDEEAARWNDVVAGDVADPAAVSELLSRNREALRALDDGLELERLQVPYRGVADDMPYDLVAWRHLGDLLLLRSRSGLEDGRISDALADALRLVRFGHLVERGQAGVITALVGDHLRSLGLRALRLSLAEPGLQPDQLPPLIERIEAARGDARSFLEALQFDYTQMAEILDDPERLGSSSGDGARSGIGSWEELRRAPLLSGYLYQPNATRKLFADSYREIARSWERHCAQLEFPDRGGERSALMRSLWAPNIVGRIVAAIGAPPARTLLVRKCEVQTEISATQALVAARAYQLERGQLPDSLAALVPRYLESSPLDDFDGQPLRYQRDRKLVYSIGRDLVDDGGDADKDTTFPIAF